MQVRIQQIGPGMVIVISIPVYTILLKPIYLNKSNRFNKFSQCAGSAKGKESE